MNNRENLPRANELNDIMLRIEDNIKQLDEIHKEGLDMIGLSCNGKRHTIYASEMVDLNLMPVIHTFIEAVQNARRRSLTEKSNEFKEL